MFSNYTDNFMFGDLCDDTIHVEEVDLEDEFNFEASKTMMDSPLSEPCSLPFEEEEASKDNCSDTEAADKEDGKKEIKRRQSLDKDAKKALNEWILEHFYDPYPTKDQKDEFCKKYNISISKLNTFFVNQRRRLLGRTIFPEARQLAKTNPKCFIFIRGFKKP